MTTQEAELFLETFQTLVMASLTPEGEPHASTAPYVRIGNDFFIIISTVAQHGRNLLATEKVSILFAEDESNMVQPFARKRITLEATAGEIHYDDPVFGQAIERLKAHFDADLVTSLLGMGDFHLFRLSPLSGNAVMGFGKAYRLNDKMEVVTHANISHRQRGKGF